MNDDEIRGRHDVIGPPSSLPAAAKVSREIGNIVREVTIVAAITTALVAGKMSPEMFAALILGMITGHYARSKAEGVVGEQTLIDLMKR